MSGKKIKVDGGVKVAAKMLQGLDPKVQAHVLETMEKMDPSKTQEIKQNMVVFEDLVHITLTMFLELQREINQDDLALALRAASPELKKHILSMLSSRIKSEVEDVLKGPPRSLEEVQKSIENIMAVVTKKVDEKKIILRSDNKDEYV